MARKIGSWNKHLESTTRSVSEISRRLTEVGVPGLTILWHPDLDRVGDVKALTGLLSGRKEDLSRLQPLFAPPDESGEARPLADPRVSRRPLHLRRLPDGSIRVDARESSTPLVANGQTVTDSRTFSSTDFETGIILLLAQRIALLLHPLRTLTRRPPRFELVGESAAMLRVREEIQRVADLSYAVLIRGETGTGKELVARAICRAGKRRKKPFVRVNAAGIATTLAAAELFGAQKGAFTGADRNRQGFFQRADGGTLFLDEIGSIAPEIQTLLLRALESEEIQPVGSPEPQQVDVQVISATDVDLESAIADGKFSSPLMHRLSSYIVELPTLRQRRDDFGRLFRHFLQHELAVIDEAWRLHDPGPGGRPWIGADIVCRLAAEPWSGNVRQLRNVVRQLVIDNRGTTEATLSPGVERQLASGFDPTPDPTHVSAPHYRKPDDVGRDELVETLGRYRWRVGPAANELNVSRTTLYKLMGTYNVPKPSDLTPEEIVSCRDRLNGDLDAVAAELRVSKRGLKLRMRKLGLV